MKTLGIISMVLAALSFIAFVTDMMNGAAFGYKHLVMAVLFGALGFFFIHRDSKRKSEQQNANKK